MMKNLFGYAGRLLRVNLTDGKITEEDLDEQTVRKYIGGVGLGAKVLFEEVPAGVAWSDEDNRIIMANGPLSATRLGGSGTICVVTKGALNNGAVSSQSNGYFGAFLKLCGFDAIVIQGRAAGWVYLRIHDGGAELRDASWLVGKDTWETSEFLKTEYGRSEKGMSVASVGPAGEHLVKFASIFFDRGHTASKDGVGAVMGSKRLKAIAVDRGTEQPSLKDKKGYHTVARQFHENIVNNPIAREFIYKWGTLNSLPDRIVAGEGIVPVKNLQTNIYDIEPEKLEKFRGPYIRSRFNARPHPCWACRMHHCHMLTITEGPYKGYFGEEPEYEDFAAFGPVIGVTDVSVVVYLSNEADRLGIDSNETGWAIGLVMECFEKGLITREDTDGLDLTWGNYEAVHELMQHIASRRGFGNILAEGAMRAARHIGGKAPNFAVHTMKGNTPRGHDHRNKWPMLFDTCVSQMSTDEGYTVLNGADLGLCIKPNALAYNSSAEDTLDWNVQCKGAGQFEDSLGVCRFVTRTDIGLLAKAVSAATGWNFTVEEAMTAGRRIVNLLRAFNLRHGHTASMDAPSPRYGSAPADGPTKGRSIMAHWDDLRSGYYEGMGWDRETGKPLPETLKALGLERAASELWGD